MGLFKNEQENRLRTGWRILLFIFIFWTLSTSIFAAKMLFPDISRSAFMSDYSVLVIALLAISATIAVYISRKYLDKKPMRLLGLKFDRIAVKDLLFGFGLSAFMALLFFLITYWMGWIDFNGINSLRGSSTNQGLNYSEFIKIASIGSLSIFLLEHIMVGYWEELVFRGYLFQNMKEGMGMIGAIVISCLIYGLLHWTNPNAGILSSSIIVFFGFLRIYGYLTTKMLWLSMGMHMGWNFFQGPIFGFSASGHETATLFNVSPIGPDWLSGGSFGPEGSIVILPILVLAIVIMKWWANSRSS